MTTALAVGRVNNAANRARVHVVASAGNLSAIVENLGRLGHEVLEFVDFAAAEQAAANAAPDLVLVDAPLAAGLRPRQGAPILLVGDDARPGSGDPTLTGVLPRHSAADVLAPVVQLAIELHQRELRLLELERLTEGMRDGTAIVGRSPSVRRLQGVLRRAADSDATVLVEGPQGAGKSLAARIVHCKSRRGHRPIVVVESATTDAEGMTAALEQARGSTLVIEDIGQLPQAAQAIVVRHLKERPAAGADTPARVVATTSAHLPELVARGAFREDLYYRLHALPIVVPALRERPEDVGVIATAILDSCVPSGGQRPAGFTASALILLESLPWPGNVAQLENVIRRAHALAGGGAIDRVHLLGPSTGLDAESDGRPRPATQVREEPDESGEIGEDAIRPFDEEEQRLLARALRATKGNVRRAAQLLAIGRATLYRKIQQYKLRLQ